MHWRCGGASGAASGNNLRQRLINHCLHLRVRVIADVPHGLRQIRGRHEEHVNVIHGEDIGQIMHGLDLFDKHHDEQDELVDTIAERIQLLGGVSIAMAADVAETTIIPRPPRGREEAPVQISRLLEAHEILLKEARTMARQASDAGDDGTNDVLVSDIIRTNELQVWFLAEHLVDVPLVKADAPAKTKAASAD